MCHYSGRPCHCSIRQAYSRCAQFILKINCEKEEEKHHLAPYNTAPRILYRWGALTSKSSWVDIMPVTSFGAQLTTKHEQIHVVLSHS